MWLLTDGLMHAAVIAGPVCNFTMESDSHLSNSVCDINVYYKQHICVLLNYKIAVT